jgi:outer membrane lipoprotein-sorting protein
MRFVMRSAVVVLVMLAWAQSAAAQTADEIIEKSIAAMGGRAAFAKVKSRTASGTITLNTPAGDIPGTIEVMNAAPNKSRTLIKADLSAFGAGPLEIDQRFDGEKGYVIDTLQGNRDITGDLLQNMKNGSFPNGFLTYKESGFSVKLAGKEKFGSGEAYVLLFEPAAGSAIRQYIDAQSMLPVRYVVRVNIPQLNADVEQITELSDYRDVDGIKLPFALSTSSSAQSYTIAISKIEHNTAIDPKLFVKP